MIRFKNVGLRYDSGPEILRDISFDIEPGSFQFLTGASGAGKSSVLKMLYLALRPSRGSLTLFNREVGDISRAEKPAIRRKIGVVFQDFHLLEHLSVIDNVALPLRIAGFPQAKIQANVEELLAWVGLGGNLRAKPSTLSGGEQQRVAIARAVIGRPRLLLADEPTGNVDDALGFRLLRLFEELHRNGTAVLVATHNEKLIQAMPYPNLHLQDGQISLQNPTVSPRPATLVSPGLVAARRSGRTKAV